MDFPASSNDLERLLAKICTDFVLIWNAICLAMVWTMDAVISSCQKVMSILCTDSLSKILRPLKYAVEYAQEAYYAQLQETPLTMKACVVFTMIVLLVVVAVIFKKSRSMTKITDDTRILSVFDMAKTAYEPGHVNALIDLVTKRNFDINYPLPNSGLSLFLCACLSGQRRLIQFLLKRGADIHQQTHDGDTALYLAVFGAMSLHAPDRDTITVIKELLTAGCDVNARNNKGYTALHRAASRGNTNVINWLLKYGADPYQTTVTGIYPIDLATNAGHLEAAELLTIELDDPYVWDVVEPHTPSRVRLGLMSPYRKHLVESTAPRPHSSLIHRT